MPRLLSPLPDLQLDPRNTRALLNAMQTKVFLESNGVLNDFSPASPLSALTEGQAYAAAELLYYLNTLPEAFALQWMKLLGVQRVVGASSYANVSFVRFDEYPSPVVVPKGTKLSTRSGLKYVLTEDVTINNEDNIANGLVISEKWGTIYNVPSGAINTIEANIAGLESVFNLEAARGGEDLESVSEMKSRINALLGRRALISKNDFIDEINTLFPNIDIVDLIDDPDLIEIDNNFPILLGSDSGEIIPENIVSLIFSELKMKTPIGVNFSLIQLRTYPVYLRISIEYNSRVNTITSIAQQVLEELRRIITPSNLGNGPELGFETFSPNIFTIQGIRNIPFYEIEVLDPIYTHWSLIHGSESDYCDNLFISSFDEDGICKRTPRNDFTDYVQMSKFESLKLYQLQINTIDEKGNILIFDYDNLYPI